MKENLDLLKTGIELEEVNCPNQCPPESTKFLFQDKDRLHGLPGMFNVYECKSCGLQRTSPRPKPQSMNYYYPDDYGPYVDSPFSSGKTLGFKGILYELFKLNSRELPVKTGYMLEIGCSSGNYMEYVRSLGWNVDGIEFSNKAAQIAINKGFNVKIGAIENLGTPDKKYDVIVAWMVMEHLHDPVKVLNNIKKWLKNDGYLVFLVPDTDGAARRIFKNLSFDIQLPTHTFHYNSQSIKTILINSGWSTERIFWQRNCNTFLKSFVNWSQEKNLFFFIRISKWLYKSKMANPLRIILSIVLGATKSSSRIEIWARPIISK